MSLRELLSSPVVDVFVGVTKRHWILHRKLLCHHTSFFQKAFEGAFKEAGLGKLDLPDEDEKAFELFTMFIYGGSIGSLPLESTKDEFREFATTYFELWVLADKLGMNKMKNSAMDKYRASLRRVAGVLSPEDVKLIYRKTASDSIFRDMVAADVAYHLVRMSPETRGAWFRRCGEGANASLDCMVDMLSLGFSSSCDIDFEDPKKMPDEHYHDR
ncbi:MAG: hypothetical protein M1817_001034 [Caeruleum heppii]|nr:MAG: hypothetical protein M1817_001034 [Caeruleum heppii]